MNKLSEIRSLDDLKEYIYLNKNSIKRAALPVTVVVALLFFWMWGMGSDNSIEKGEGEVREETEQYSPGDSLEEENSQPIPIYVDISGCVNTPGVYQVTEGTRVFQLIEKAGGLTADADIQDINRAEEVYDGQKIVIFAKGKEQEEEIYGEDRSAKININRADETQLQNIPGVGPATAQKIIEYRQTTGRFTSIEDIKNVSGIGEKTFESMKEYITV